MRMAHCHCRDCQRVSGSGHMSIAFFKAEAVSVDGETRAFTVTAESGNRVTRHFCPTCGSRVFIENTGRPGLIGIAAGSMEDQSWFSPQFVLFTRNRAAWDATPTDIPNFEGASPPPAPAT